MSCIEHVTDVEARVYIYIICKEFVHMTRRLGRLAKYFVGTRVAPAQSFRYVHCELSKKQEQIETFDNVRLSVHTMQD